jgi:hypothetical protein
MQEKLRELQAKLKEEESLVKKMEEGEKKEQEEKNKLVEVSAFSCFATTPDKNNLHN